jgi:hypothetical protein
MDNSVSRRGGVENPPSYKRIMQTRSFDTGRVFNAAPTKINFTYF